MNKHYHQLTLGQRYQIWSLRDIGKMQKVIADFIEVQQCVANSWFDFKLMPGGFQSHTS